MASETDLPGARFYTLAVDPTNLSSGVYDATFTVTRTLQLQAPQQFVFPVHIVVKQGIWTSASTLTFASDNQAFPAPQTLTIYGPPATVVTTTKTGGAWLTAQLINQTDIQAQYSIAVDATGLADGYEGAIVISAPTIDTMTIPVKLAVNMTNSAAFYVTSAPQGMTVFVNGTRITTPWAFPWVANQNYQVTAPYLWQTVSSGVRARPWLTYPNSTGHINRSSYKSGKNPVWVTGLVVADQQFKLNVVVSPGGAGLVAGGGWYDQQRSATLAATAADGYIFDHFEIPGAANVASPNATVLVDAPKTVTAVFRAR
jgi:hypothetical protein